MGIQNVITTNVISKICLWWNNENKVEGIWNTSFCGTENGLWQKMKIPSKAPFFEFIYFMSTVYCYIIKIQSDKICWITKNTFDIFSG